jgi:hypothetical protein
MRWLEKEERKEGRRERKRAHRRGRLQWDPFMTRVLNTILDAIV